MIRVLVVDDDKLVRKGLISSMPWQPFDMVVVGEANNGETALHFLETAEVDLLLVDLAMPVMSGLELMRIVSRRYPKIHVVVLTFHQDFEYVQEALRLGAIDYIAKVDLEKEQFEEVLGRISRRIGRERNRVRPPDRPTVTPALFQANSGVALLATSEPPDVRWVQRLDLPEWELVEIANGLWLWTPTSDENFEGAYSRLTTAIAPEGRWVMIRLEGLSGENRNSIQRLLRNYQGCDFFYEHDLTTCLIAKSVAELKNQRGAGTEEAIGVFRERWLTFNWVYRAPLFTQLLTDLAAARIPLSRLLPLLGTIEHELNRLCGSIMPLQLPSTDGIHSWYELERWLVAAREQAFHTICRKPYSENVAGSIIAALEILKDELSSPLTAQEIARRVHLSRSYFNQCFRDISGKPFNDYLRRMRMDRAQELLRTTDQSIHWVAEQAGYIDEKYFSHLFKEHTGMLPTEFRRSTQVQ